MTTDTIPRAYATVTGPHATFVGPDGQPEPISATGDEDIRRVVVRRATDHARRAGTALELVTSGDRGEHRLLISAAGEITAAPADVPEPRNAPTPGVNVAPPPEPDPPDHTITGDSDADADADLDAGSDGTIARRSFITSGETQATGTGWRHLAARAGIRIPETKTQRARREAIASVSRHWAGYRNIAVANGKGGVGKTMTSSMLAAVFARHGGGNVLAWDNNDTRGTLGWRTEQGLYDTTIRDLLPAAPDLLSATASVSDISRFVHHQSADRYDVLRSNPELLAAHQRIEHADFDLLMQVAMHYYRLIVFDSGNDESADRWLRMIDSAHQLVIPTLPSPESAESASLLLEALRQRDRHSANLAANAVVIVTQPEAGSRRDIDAIAAGFTDQVRVVETVPFDPALKSGPLRFDALRRTSQDAWIRVAAAIATGLS
ncbi:AAA family ATPase [Microbacterium sp. YMB-B2]|uniref:AAA family ATPase n=1 Tax=Microbacterium tenebrionis TaxID=2830665 RepID=A0A9X1LN75_9MICO|nr:AAA family ATPase [Microbacterium tenebrionis]MCC2028834.1 AAA family ATPase [Microbacterium tenebrionis]